MFLFADIGTYKSVFSLPFTAVWYTVQFYILEGADIVFLNIKIKNQAFS